MKTTKVKTVDDNHSWIMYEYTHILLLCNNKIVHDSFVLCMLRKRILKQEKNGIIHSNEDEHCIDEVNFGINFAFDTDSVQLFPPQIQGNIHQPLMNEKKNEIEE